MDSLSDAVDFNNLCQALFSKPTSVQLDRVMMTAKHRFGALAVGHRLSTYQPTVLTRKLRSDQLTSRYGWPAEFMSQWVKQGFAQDFAIHQLHKTHAPVCAWHLAKARASVSGPMATSVAFMMKHGIAAGISVMVPRLNGDYGSLICIYDRENAHLAGEMAERRAPDLLFLASSVVYALEHLSEGVRPAELSPQQVTCLRWVKAGKTDQEIAEIILCSVNTVRYHIKTALKDLGASNRTHAVVLAIEHRLI